MSKSSEYKDKVIIRKVMIDSYDDLNGFDGKSISAEDFSEKFKVQVTPTLLLLNHQGKKLTKKIVGYNRSGFFGLYLDEAIDKARQKVALSGVN
jgi:thioredoxin-related protein